LFTPRGSNREDVVNVDACLPCGETQTMSHIVNSCPLTKFDGGLLRLQEADEAAVDWLTTYGSYHTIIIITMQNLVVGSHAVRTCRRS